MIAASRINSIFPRVVVLEHCSPLPQPSSILTLQIPKQTLRFGVFRLLYYKETNRTPGRSLPSCVSSITSFSGPALWKREESSLSGTLTFSQVHTLKTALSWDCLAARCLGLKASTAGGAGSISGPGERADKGRREMGKTDVGNQEQRRLEGIG